MGARLLIATGERSKRRTLPPLIHALLAEASDVLVVAPMVVSRLEWLVSDIDRARYEADERLAKALGYVEALATDADVRAEVVDKTPLEAIADAARRFRADHLLIAPRAGDHRAWQERRLLDRSRDRLHVPMTVFEIDRTGRVPQRDVCASQRAVASAPGPARPVAAIVRNRKSSSVRPLERPDASVSSRPSRTAMDVSTACDAGRRQAGHRPRVAPQRSADRRAVGRRRGAADRRARDLAVARALDPNDPDSAELLKFLLKGYRRDVSGDRMDVRSTNVSCTATDLAVIREAGRQYPEAFEAMARARAAEGEGEELPALPVL